MGLSFHDLWNADWLERLFDEVHRVVSRIANGKASRLDGLSMAYFQVC